MVLNGIPVKNDSQSQHSRTDTQHPSYQHSMNATTT